MGVPKAINAWVDTFSYLLAGMAKGITEKDEIEEAEATYTDPDTGEEVEDFSYRGKMKMDGKEVMDWTLKLGGYSDLKELLDDPNFKNFPMYKPILSLTVIFVPDKVWKAEIEGKDISDASHGWSPSTIKLATLGGSNIVFTGQEFSFKTYVPNSWLDNFDTENFRKMLKTTIAHELTHAYEVYMRYKGTEDPFMGRESFLNAATRLMSDKKYPQWNQFLHLIYLHLSFEINARITQLYYEMKNKDVSTKEEFMEVLKNSNAWKEMKMLEDFDAEEFINNFKYKDISLFDMLEDLGKQVSRKEQGLPIIGRIKGSKEGMQHLITGWDAVLQILNKDLNKSGMYKGKFMDKVPTKAKEDPRIFFKFFEKRFHKKAEKFKKKLLRLSSLVLDENEKSN